VQQKSAPLSSETDKTSTSNSPTSKSPSNYLLAWVPESTLAGDDLSTYVKVDMKDGESPPKTTYFVPPPPVSSTYDDSNVGPYAFSLPLSSIYSILVRPPSLGWWFGSVVINTKSGSSLPALFFHDSECESTILQKKKRQRESFDPFGEHGGLFWGGDEVVRWLKRYINVERSAADPSVYLIDPSEEDKIGFGQARKSVESQRGQSKERRKSQGGERKAQPGGPGMDPLTKALKETRWKVLEQMSKITTFARRTAQDVANNDRLPPQMRRLLQNPEVQTIQDEFDSARLYLARWAMGIAEQSDKEKRQRIWTAKDVLEMEESSVGEFEILDMEAGRMSLGGDSKRQPVDIKEWKGYFDSKGKLTVTEDEIKERIFHGGLDPEDGVRKEAWLFLLGVYDWQSTAAERTAHMNSKRDEFVRLKGTWWDRMVEREATQEEDEWWKEQKGRIGKSRPSPNLLVLEENFLADHLTDRAIRSTEKDVHRTDRHIPLFAGEDIPHPDPTSPFHQDDAPGTNVHLEQLKDMLLTYIEYDTPSTPTHPNTSNPSPQNLGYVQGMSDLLSPLYAIFQDDAVAFWAFCNFMTRMSRNFVRNQSGMRSQLSTLDQLVQILDPQLYLHLQSADSTNFFFFFRMLLVWYKREFDWTDILRLWEGLWTDYLSSQFHLFIAVAILEKHRDVIMDHLKQFDEVLKYINELSGTIDLQSTLLRAEGLFRRFERTVQAVDKKDNFPQAPVTQRKKLTSGRGSLDVFASGSDARPTSSDGEKKPIISSELRLLLSREVIVLDQLPEDGASDDRKRASGLRD
jgi:hypothetical protein